MQIVLRPAQASDFAYCAAVYFSEGHGIIEELKLNRAALAADFRAHWEVNQVRIITRGGTDIGWLQSSAKNDVILLAQFFISAASQRQGIGTTVLNVLIDESVLMGRAITLGVVKTNPALRLYRRLGFFISSEDTEKYYMRREPEISAPLANLRP